MLRKSNPFTVKHRLFSVLTFLPDTYGETPVAKQKLQRDTYRKNKYEIRLSFLLFGHTVTISFRIKHLNDIYNAKLETINIQFNYTFILLPI